MKWFFALNADSIAADKMYSNCVEVAVLSALQHTSLEPHFLFDGPDCDLTDRLRRLGVRIIQHQSSFTKLIASTNTHNPHWQQTARGAFLRVDIPDIERESEFVIYTDCDVMFVSDPKLDGIRPKYFAVAPEFGRGDYAHMNSGVMVMNLAGMRSIATEFRAYIRDHLAECVTYDQTALQIFFRGLYDHLPETLNWKPYWGFHSESEIIHFHGPKPPHVRTMMHDEGAAFPELLWQLFNSNRDTYAAFDSLWHAYLSRATRMRPSAVAA